MKQALTRNPAISSDAPKTGRVTVEQVWKHYAASMAVYGALVVLLTYNPWFSGLLKISYKDFPALHVYYWAFGAYAVLAPVIYLMTRPESLWESKNLLIVGYVGRVLRYTPGNASLRPTTGELNAIAFLLIKLMYGPLMLNSAMEWLPRIEPMWKFLAGSKMMLSTCNYAYGLLVAVVFTFDAVIFFIGYHTEAGFLRNRLRKPDTNLIRVLVCICCYPPFNAVTISVLGASFYDYLILFKGDLNHPVTWILRGLAVLCLLGIFFTELSLFTKASNLTNRGIVTWGPYAVIRHPGYLAKNLLWLLTLVPLFVPNSAAADFSWWKYAVFCASTVLGWLGWATIYFLRAITEEQFLMSDPDYVAYCKKVRYRFILGVY